MNKSNSLYTRLGGEMVIRAFVSHLYDYMDSTPEVVHIRDMHSADMSQTRDRLFMFLSGMLGGPPLYMDEFGPPRLRRRHFHIVIGEEERDQWLMCAQHAADLMDVEDSLRDELMLDLTVMANHLRNKGEIDKQCFDTKVAS